MNIWHHPMPIVNSHIVPQVACPGDNPLLALLEEKPGAGILNRVSCVIGHNEWGRSSVRRAPAWHAGGHGFESRRVPLETLGA